MWEKKKKKPQQHSKQEFEPASIAHTNYLFFHYMLFSCWQKLFLSFQLIRSQTFFLSLNSYVMYIKSHSSTVLQTFPLLNALVGEKPKKNLLQRRATKIIRRLEHLSQEDNLRDLALSILEKALGRPQCGLQYFKGRRKRTYKRRKRDFLYSKQ